MSHPFAHALHELSDLRAANPAVRYGRHYFRPLSGDHRSFGVSSTSPGIVAFSRLLSRSEMLVVANASVTEAPVVDVIVDRDLHPADSQFRLLWSNRPGASPTLPVEEQTGVVVSEVDGSRGTGPLHVVPITLGPTEAAIYERTA